MKIKIDRLYDEGATNTMTLKTPKFLLFVVITALLSACSSKPIKTIQYYLLDKVPAPKVEAYKANLIEFKGVELPSYLKNNRLMILEKDNRLNMANYHYWADDFAAMVQRSLAAHIETRAKFYSVVSSCKGCLTLDMSIEHFYPTAEGKVVLSGDFTLGGLANNESISKHYSFEVPIDEPGYARSVELMSDLLGRVSEEISLQLP